MQQQYLGRVAFSNALEQQGLAYSQVQREDSIGVVLGFESDPVITLGLRGRAGDDLVESVEGAEKRGFAVVRVDRGGQATLHNPGQLVIFPVVSVRAIGARAWICMLAKTTRGCLAEFGFESAWNERRPGIYTARGKIAAMGVRIRNGISTHGVAINVANEIDDFQWIRACGVEHAAVDKMGDEFALETVFKVWTQKFRTELTRSGFSHNL